jgi:Lsr2
MAQKVTVRLEDDLDGSPAAERVQFRYEGTAYEIDLSAANAQAFRNELAPFIRRARTPARRAPRTAAGRKHSADIRAWAKEHGIPVNARGRIPARVIEQYTANPTEATQSGRAALSTAPVPGHLADEAPTRTGSA